MYYDKRLRVIHFHFKDGYIAPVIFINNETDQPKFMCYGRNNNGTTCAEVSSGALLMSPFLSVRISLVNTLRV